MFTINATLVICRIKEGATIEEMQRNEREPLSRPLNFTIQSKEFNGTYHLVEDLDVPPSEWLFAGESRADYLEISVDKESLLLRPHQPVVLESHITLVIKKKTFPSVNPIAITFSDIATKMPELLKSLVMLEMVAHQDVLSLQLKRILPYHLPSLPYVSYQPSTSTKIDVTTHKSVKRKTTSAKK